MFSTTWKIILSPPLAFVFYVGLTWLLFRMGRRLAGPEAPSLLKSSLYTGGESDHTTGGAPGYRPFFVIALFFAILHLGVLMLGTGSPNGMTIIFLIGLIVALLALILG
jgi:hypothetical protein